MQHVEIAVEASGRSDIEQRLTGRFYTPESVAETLALTTMLLTVPPTTIGDPFCGDGRLVLMWLRVAKREKPVLLKRLRRIVLWDYDEASVALAAHRVRAALSLLGVSDCLVDARSGDTFERASLEPTSIDVLLTNPPWELLKPDSRDGLGAARNRYTASLRGYAAQIAFHYPESLSAKGKAMAGYGVNLARAGALASLRLLAPNGVLAIVLPSSIFADQASQPFRHAMYTSARAELVEWFPAEAKVFPGVDQSFVTYVAKRDGPTERLRLVRRSTSLSVDEERDVLVSSSGVALSFNVAGEHETLVRELTLQYPTLKSFEENPRYGLWLGRELDETRIAESFTLSPQGVPFLKGRNVFPWVVRHDELPYIDPTKRAIPRTVEEVRLAWRDVSRPTQRRRMHVALVPEGAVTGNSLGVAFFRTKPNERIRLLLAVLNSFVFELQVRTLLSTAHVSQGILRRCAVPEQLFTDSKLAQRVLTAVEERLDSRLETARVEVEVARSFGLDRAAMEVILSAFPKVSSDERAIFLQRELWR